MAQSEYIPPVSAIVDGTPNDAPFGDGRNETGTDDTEPQKSINGQSLGPWITDPPEKVAKEIDKLWVAQQPAMKQRITKWDFNDRRRGGDTYSKLIHDIDQDSVRIYTPVGAEHAPPSLNKTDEMCEKVVANLIVDPPKAEAEPSKDDDQCVDAAEFSTRFLDSELAESSVGLLEAIDEAEDVACTAGSGFIRFYVDPCGGGSRPKSMQASQAATHADNALFATVPAQPAGVDEMGQPTPEQPEQKVPQPEPYLLRHVKPDASLTDDPKEADREWLPAIKRDVMSGRHIRFLPETAQGIHDAEGCLIAAYTTFGKLRRLFPTVQKMSVTDQRALTGYKPPQTKTLLPRWAKELGDRNKPDGSPSDDTQVLTITAVKKESPEHPEGAYVVMAGGKFLLDRRPWSRTVKDPATGQEEVRGNSLPVAQFRQFFSLKDRDPYGRGLVDKLLDGDPLMAIAIGSLIEFVYRANNPHIFVPIGSGLNDKAMSLPRGTPIPYNPAGGGLPKQEEIGTFPSEVMELYGYADDRMNSVSGLQETAQGLENADSQSGKAKQLVVEQALVALSRVKRGFEQGFICCCRIILEMAQMAYTSPKMLKVVGEDGAYKYKEWTGADLGSTVDVKIQAGTSTMLTPSAKSSIAMEKFTAGALSLEDFQEQERTNMRSVIGLEDDPNLLRVKRQIGQWTEGAPEGWQPQPAQIDPQTGQPIPTADPANPFAQVLPSDEVPEVAKLRFRHLGRALAGTKFQKQPPEWQQFFIQEYERMRYAAGVQTVREQYQAQQAQAEQTAQAGQQQQEHTAKQDTANKAHELEVLRTKGLQSAEEQAAALRAKAVSSPQTGQVAA